MLLLGLDGARWDIIAENGVGVFLTEMAQQGAFRIMVMEPPTLSGPGWSSILTGY
ncbi:MAG TPA: alkaline phosphatase family protein [Corynebacterium glutamicum]|nr:alkaline phosphatase family protein [Corynebacterium glutamicum]